MSFFSKKISDHEATITRLTAVIAAVGLAADATPEAAAAHVETIETNAAAEAAGPLNARIAALEPQAAQATILRAGLADAGVRLADSDVTAAAVKAAIETRTAAAAAKVIAGAGHEALNLPQASAEGEPKLTSQEALAAFNALTDPKERAAFYSKHRAVLMN